MAGTRVIKESKTEGIKPAVLYPSAVGLLAAVILFITGDNQTATAILVSTVSYAGIGGAVGPGKVRVRR